MYMPLRNRSRAVTTSNSKQALMTDHSSQSPTPSTQNCRKPVASFLFGSPRFKAFTFNKGLPEAELIMSPTSILDTTRPFSPFKNPFWYDTSQPKSPTPRVFPDKKHPLDKVDTKGIGVALIDDDDDNTLTDKKTEDQSDSISKPRMVLHGTKLRVQIPPHPTSGVSPVESPISPAEFGIKTRNLVSPASGSVNSGIPKKDSPWLPVGCLNISEIELSEDYTCVITHGPNPTTTHIFDDCILDNYCSVSSNSKSLPKSFLSFCHTCKRNLEQTHDIYIYRGEKAFCSSECRYQEMLIDEIEN